MDRESESEISGVQQNSFPHVDKFLLDRKETFTRKKWNYCFEMGATDIHKSGQKEGSSALAMLVGCPVRGTLPSVRFLFGEMLIHMT